MKMERLAIPEILLISQKVHGDKRGYFMEVYNAEQWRSAQLPAEGFIQDNVSFSERAGTVRGLHYQVGKNAQAKLFHCLSGAVLDVIVDMRKNSPHFGKSVAVELAGGSGKQVFIPKGFAHGFVTLAPNTLVQYKVSASYDPAAERGVFWNDPELKIDWRVSPDNVTLSERDQKWPFFKQAEYF